jgi:M6 family metalloprotease-like protein
MKLWPVVLVLAAGCGAPPRAAQIPGLPELRTVETAKTATIVKGAKVQSDQPAWLGIHLAGTVVADVAESSPAEKAGVKRGDVLLAAGDQEVEDAEALRDIVHARTPGETLALALERGGTELEVTATLGSVSRPMKPAEQRALLGVQVGDPSGEEGAPITRITRGMPAEKAGLKVGDRILSVEGAAMDAAARLTETLSGRSPGDTVTLAVHRGGKTEELKVQLAADPNQGDSFFRGGSYWKKDVYRLAVIPIEFPDVKRNAKIALKDWEESLFSKGTYRNKQSVTGQTVYGSMNDYYLEQSYGALRVEGRVFEWVTAEKNRMDYSPGTGTGMRNKTALLSEALDKLLARDGKDALANFDGIYFIYAGDRVQTSRGGLYWPHRASVTHQGKRWAYFIIQEGGSRMGTISVVAHEFGHMLGLPDLYARPENPGSEGLGNWCAMSDQIANGRPQHFGAWCKEQLGWIKPVVIDPRVPQRLVLAPIEDSPRECFKVLVRPDGSEYFLLENRRKKGFDQDLPAEGLLVWRVLRNRPVLEESHGVDGPSGPRSYVSAVPYPSAANDAFTPHTTPSSRSLLGGGWPVYITSIRRLPDGKVTFTIGVEYD